MILADTSVWIDHLRHGHSRLGRLLLDGEVLSHPFVIGELACGFLTKRGEILSLLETLPKVVIADHFEVLRLTSPLARIDPLVLVKTDPHPKQNVRAEHGRGDMARDQATVGLIAG